MEPICLNCQYWGDRQRELLMYLSKSYIYPEPPYDLSKWQQQYALKRIICM